MPSNLVDVSAFTSPVVVPTDGDAASAASVGGAFQALANRTAFLNNIVSPSGGSGVTLLRSGTLATMQALTGMADGSVFLVPGRGLYVYNAASALTSDNLLVVTASGGGRWLHELQTVANVSPGLAVIGTAGANANRIPPSVVPNGIVAAVSGKSSSSFSNNTTTPGDAFTLSVPSCNAGDVLLIHALASLVTSPTGQAPFAQIAVVDGTSAVKAETVFTLASAPVAASGVLQYSVTTFHTVVNAGSITIKLQAALPPSASGYTVTVNTNAFLLALQVRP